MSVRRFDKGSLRKAERLPNGFVKVDAYLTRAGIFEYRLDDGSVRREYRPPDEVFRGDSLASFELAPLTNEHPDQLVTVENVKTLQVGTVGLPVRDGDHMRATLMVTDPGMIAEMDAGKLETSCGYECDLSETPGEINGQRFDAVQKNIVANHVAVVARGRAGASVRARMDSAEGCAVVSDPTGVNNDPEEKTLKIRLDTIGLEAELTETAAPLVEKELSARAEALKAAQANADKQTARADAAEAKANALKTELAEAPEKVRAELKAAIALEETAREILGDVKLDGLSADEIKRKVVAQVMPELSTEGKSSEYVGALFEASVKQFADDNSAFQTVRADTAEKNDAEQTYRDLLANAWKPRAERK